MVITRKKPKNRWDLKIFLNNKKIQQEDTIKYLGITIDRRFTFNEHIENITGKCIKIIHALSKSAKINWGLRHDVLRIIYAGGNTTYPIIRSTDLDRMLGKKTHCHKTQKSTETYKYKNRKSIPHHIS